MKRSEFAYRVLVPILFLSGLIVIPIMQTDILPAWLPGKIAGVAALVFIFSFCLIGYYEFHDPKRSYRCRACGFTTVIPRPPYTFFEKFIVGFFALSVLVVLGLTAVLALSIK